MGNLLFAAAANGDPGVQEMAGGLVILAVFIWGVSRLFRGGRKGWGTFAIISIFGWGIFIAIWGFFFTPKPGSSLYLSMNKGDDRRIKADRMWGRPSSEELPEELPPAARRPRLPSDPPSIWEEHPDLPKVASRHR